MSPKEFCQWILFVFYAIGWLLLIVGGIRASNSDDPDRSSTEFLIVLLMFAYTGYGLLLIGAGACPPAVLEGIR